MDKELFDIGDNEIRVLGPKEPRDDTPKPKRNLWLWLLLALLLVVLAVVYFLSAPRGGVKRVVAGLLIFILLWHLLWCL